MTANFNVDVPEFTSLINSRAIVFGIGREEAFKTEARLLAEELIKRTPPFSGKSIVKMLGAQGRSLTFRNLEVEELSAQKVGMRRVEKDIRRVILGVRGASWPKETPTTIVSQTNPRQARHSNKLEFGILQKVRGKNAVRVYADQSGKVYGIDTEKFDPKASMSDLAKWHKAARTKRGRVTTAGQKDLVVGRWRWLNKIVTKAQTVSKYVKMRQKQVGQAKGGWAAAFMRFGGRMSLNGWIGKHAARFGRVRSNFTTDQIAIRMTNQSRWASAGDPDAIIPKAIAGRAESLKAAIWRQMNDAWKKGGKAGRVELPR